MDYDNPGLNCRPRFPETDIMSLKVQVDREDDGRWIAEIPELEGVMAYGKTRGEAITRVQTLALRVIADRLEHGENVPDLGQVFAVVA